MCSGYLSITVYLDKESHWPPTSVIKVSCSRLLGPSHAICLRKPDMCAQETDKWKEPIIPSPPAYHPLSHEHKLFLHKKKHE